MCFCNWTSCCCSCCSRPVASLARSNPFVLAGWMLEAMGSCGLVLGTRRDLDGGCRELARGCGVLGCRRVALGFGCVELGCRGGVPGRCCSVPGWGCEDLGRGSVAVATVAASACLDDAPILWDGPHK